MGTNLKRVSVSKLLKVLQTSWHVASGAFVAMFGMVLITISVTVIERSIFTPPPKIELEQKIKSLTEALNSSARTIAEIENEITERKNLVDRLQADAALAQKLSAVNKDQVQAIAQTLKSELERQERSGFWTSQFQNFAYTCLGVLLAELYHWMKRRMARREEA